MKYAILLTAILLAGCATEPRPQMMVSQPLPHHKLVAKPAPAVVAPVVPATPNQAVKKRWYEHFPKHPKFFHSK